MDKVYGRASVLFGSFCDGGEVVEYQRGDRATKLH